jgi:PAS domain S-box-containing protein
VLVEKNELEKSRGSESLLRLLIDSIPAFISYIDSEQRYVLANALYAAFFGKGLREIIGRHISEVLGDEAYQNVRTHVEAALRGQRQSYEYALPHAGETRYLRAMYVPHIENCEVKGIFVLAIDITKQKQLERELAVARIIKTVGYARRSDFSVLGRISDMDG